MGSLVCVVALGAAPAPATPDVATPRPGASANAAAVAGTTPGKAPTVAKPVSGAVAGVPAKTGAAAPGTASTGSATGGAIAGAGSAGGAATSTNTTSLTAPIDNLHRHELEDVHRQDLATALARHNILIDWHEHKLAELVDWRDRVEVASLIGVEQDLELDWRTMSLGDLNDIRLRATKSAELAAAFGVTIDWRLYSWRQLEELRRAVAKIQASEVPNTADGKGRKPRAVPGRPKPTGPPVPVVGARNDREAVTDL